MDTSSHTKTCRYCRCTGHGLGGEEHPGQGLGGYEHPGHGLAGEERHGHGLGRDEHPGHALGEIVHLGHSLGGEEHPGHVLGVDDHLSPDGAASIAPTEESVRIQSIKAYMGSVHSHSLINCQPKGVNGLGGHKRELGEEIIKP